MLQRFTFVALVGSVLASAGEARKGPWQLPPPTKLQCGGAVAGSVSGQAPGGALSVSAVVDPKVADVVSFMVARADDPERWAFLHYSVAVGSGDGVARAELPDLEPGAEYLLMARAHARGQELGYHKWWSQVAHLDGSCAAVTAPPAEAPSGPAGGPATRWLEVYRRNGPTMFNPSLSAEPTNNYTLPDFLENHNAFGTAPLDPGMLFGAEKYTNASFARYCVELEVVSFSNVTTPGYVYNKPGPIQNVTSGYADYLSCNAGKCVPMICGDRCTMLNHEAMEQECPMTPVQHWWSKWHYNPNATSVPEKQEQECFYKEKSWLPPRACQGRNLAQSLRYVGVAGPAGGLLSFPIGGQCPVGAAVGDGGCTWREAPLSHTVSQGNLMARGSFDPAKSFEQRASATFAAFAEAGALPCGATQPAVMV